MVDYKKTIAQLYFTKGAGVDNCISFLENESFDTILLDGNVTFDFTDDEIPKIFIVDYEYITTDGDRLATILNSQKRRDSIPILVTTLDRIDESTKIDDELYFDYLTKPFSRKQVLQTIRNALDHLRYQIETIQLNQTLTQRHKELEKLTEIGTALSSEHDHNSLLNMILMKSREITCADSGTLYLVEEGDMLRFKLSQNETLDAASYTAEYSMPITEQSIAGYVAKNGKIVNLEDSYKIPPGSKFIQNRKYDDKFGYRTKSMLTVPMQDHKGIVIGVIQLINKKIRREIKLLPISRVDEVVIPFVENDERLAVSLASQAAVSIENNLLYENIQNLFEGFVKASVTAVESRDPATSGHSERVAILTVGLAEAVEKTAEARFRDVKFSRDQIKEIRYASLLHDFGKVGVREKVLVKPKKLYDHDLKLIQSRFDFIKRTKQWQMEKRKLEFLLSTGRMQFLEQADKLDRSLERELNKIDEYLQIVIAANEPSVVKEGNFKGILEIANFKYENFFGQEKPYITSEELRFLSIRRGSIDDKEREEINSHVTHSYNFLSKIPWTNEIKNVPKIAYGHHEKLDGSGYPNNFNADEIPIQTRMMTIADIYDALSASDRPYKPALSPERSIDILINEDASNGKIDNDLVRLFVEAKVYEKTRDYKKNRAQ